MVGNAPEKSPRFISIGFQNMHVIQEDTPHGGTKENVM
jgi:hypothetical protein